MTERPFAELLQEWRDRSIDDTNDDYRKEWRPETLALQAAILVRVAALEADKLRMDWLEDMRHRLMVLIVDKNGSREFLATIERVPGQFDWVGGKSPRDAIDHAMAARKDQP